MKVRNCLHPQEIIAQLEAVVLAGNPEDGEPIAGICASDLMSDVLSFSKSHYLLLTSLVNPQTIRTAEITELTLVCFVNGKLPGAEVTALAQGTGIILLSTGLSMFEACGKLYQVWFYEK